MSVLKVEYKEKILKEKTLANSKLVGAHLPQQVWGYLTLYSLAHGITKSTVLRNEMQNWYDKRSETEGTLIKLLIKRARRQAESSTLHIGLFKRKLGIDLKHKGISKEHIETILTAL